MSRVMDHLGVEVFSTDEVNSAIQRLSDAGLVTLEENNTECCYAFQDKVWVRGPGNEPWEVCTVKADSPQLEKIAESACCTATAETEPATGGTTSSCC